MGAAAVLDDGGAVQFARKVLKEGFLADESQRFLIARRSAPDRYVGRG